MSYATAAELLDRFDAEEIAQVATPKEHVPVAGTLLRLTVEGGDRSAYSQAEQDAADAAVVKINKAISDAEGDVDSHLQGRYKLPLANPPKTLNRIVCSIARFYLYDDRAPEIVAKVYDDSIKFLRSVSRGDLDLGIDDQGNKPESTGAAQMQSDDTVFGRDSDGFI